MVTVSGIGKLRVWGNLANCHALIAHKYGFLGFYPRIDANLRELDGNGGLEKFHFLCGGDAADEQRVA
jgi:hypothetical protein